MKGGIKAIIFDIGDVLRISSTHLTRYKKNKIHLGVHEEIAKKLKIPIDQYFDSIDTAYSKSIEGKISQSKALSAIAKNFKISQSKTKKLFFVAYKKHFKQNKFLFNQAFKLKKQGYKIAILSDQWHLSKNAVMPLKLYKMFDVVVVSCDVGLRKPNPKIYKLVLKKLKLKPFETIFIDNQTWNLEPAKKLKMNTILFENNESLIKNKKWRDLFK